MNTAVLFANTGVLDFLELRTSIVRIPEVLHYLKRAQVFLDRSMGSAPDLIQFLVSEDHVFWKSERVRKVAVGVVQIALYERFSKRFGQPNFILATNTMESAIKVVSGEMRLGEYVINLVMTEDKVKKAENDFLPSHLSRGISMPELVLFEKNSSDEEGALVYKTQNNEKKALHDLLQILREEQSIYQCINIGPGQSVSGSAMAELMDRELNIMESIDLDPMLTWFWDLSSDYSFQVAN